MRPSSSSFLARTLFAAALLSGGLRLSAQSGARSHLDFQAEARAAYAKKDYAAALAATAEALKLRPDSPRYLHNLAALSVRTGDTAAAFGHLRRLAALGVVTPIERDPDLAPLQGTPDFARILSLFAAHREPQGAPEILAELPGRTGLVEGIAARDATGDLFLGDVRQRTIWRRARGGELVRFTPDHEDLAGVFALAVDEPRRTLWATLAAVPQMEGYEADMKGFTALAEFDLASGELRHVTPVPLDGRDHLLGDLAVASDGTVFATDSRAPVIWQFAPGADEPAKFLEAPGLSSLQGIVLQGRTLLVADYSHGLLSIDLSTRAIVALAPPENVTLLGLDGLVAIPGGLVATQNGTVPQRVLRLQLAPGLDRIESVTVLASGQPYLTDLTLVTLLQDRPTLVAGSGWEFFENPSASRPAAAPPVRLVQVDATPAP